MTPLHPGEMLREEFMKPLGLSANALAMELRVPVTRITKILRERRGITADTAIRLARYFNMTPEFWMRLQMDFDLESEADAAQAAIRNVEHQHRIGVDVCRAANDLPHAAHENRGVQSASRDIADGDHDSAVGHDEGVEPIAADRGFTAARLIEGVESKAGDAR